MAQDRLETDTDPGPTDECTVERSELDGMSLGVAVPAAVASRTDANVVELDPVCEVVDVDALDDIWGLADGGKWVDGTRITFPYMGYEVSVTPGELHLEPLGCDGVGPDGNG